MQVTIVYSPAARQICEWALEVAPGSNIKQVLMQSSLLIDFADLAIDTLHAGVWGKPYGLNHKLNEHDRIEIYRPLRVDPKVARRERFSRQGAKSAGLFANKRAGAKAGYGG